MSLTGFGVKNLRCLTDTGVVPLKPITLLVGKNSSGKSSFLRAFPLLRQSVSTARSAPILWYDPAFVDFGSFSDAINHHASERVMGFRFRADLDFSVRGRPFAGGRDCNIDVELAEGTAGMYVASYSIQIEGYRAILRAAPDGTVIEFTVDGVDAIHEGQNLRLAGPTNLLPIPLASRSVETARLTYQAVPPSIFDLGHPPDELLEQEWPALDDARRALMGKEDGDAWKWRLGGGIPFAPYQQALKEMKLQAKGGAKKLLRAIKVTDERFKRFLALEVATVIPNAIDALSDSIAEFAAGISYVAPRRASALRAYRIQDLAVEEVDARGENLCMFLRSLAPEELESFSTFTRAYLGIEVALRSERLHTEILIKERGADRFVNLVDSGFGFAELLPLAATLWSSAARRRDYGAYPVTMVCIEQPELHLHPSRQATLPRLLAGALHESRKAREAGHEMKLMVETHSDAVINQLGMLVRAGKVACEDVQIVFFDQDPVTRDARVVVTGYEPDGALQESWPFGFLVGVPDPLDEGPAVAAEE